MQTEELFLDFKQAVSTGKNGTSLHKDDRKNLAKGISGFGNSEGGVIVWGVECSRDCDIGDVAKAKVKVKNVHRFLSWLENAISGCTIPSAIILSALTRTATVLSPPTFRNRNWLP